MGVRNKLVLLALQKKKKKKKMTAVGFQRVSSRHLKILTEFSRYLRDETKGETIQMLTLNLIITNGHPLQVQACNFSSKDRMTFIGNKPRVISNRVDVVLKGIENLTVKSTGVLNV